MPGGVGVERVADDGAMCRPSSTRHGWVRRRTCAATVVAVPAAGQVKGVDGPDWAVACVLFEVRATITVEARIGYGYCERMQWQQRPVDDRPRRPTGASPVDLAGQRAQHPGRLADLGRRGGGMSRGT